MREKSLVFTNLLVFLICSLWGYCLIVLADWKRSGPKQTAAFSVVEGSITTTITVSDSNPGYQPGDRISVAGESYRIVAVRDGEITLDRGGPDFTPGCGYFGRKVSEVRQGHVFFYDAPPMPLDGKSYTPGTKSILARNLKADCWINMSPVIQVSYDILAGEIVIWLLDGRNFVRNPDHPVSVDAWV